MLYFFRVLIILLKGIIPRFASVISMVSNFHFRFGGFGGFGGFAGFAGFGGFVSLFRVLVHAFALGLNPPFCFLQI